MSLSRPTHAITRTGTAAVFFALCLGAQSSHAFGPDEVYAPNTEYGEFSVEVSHARAFDASPSKDSAQVGEITLEAGITPRVTVEISGEYSADPGMPLQLDAHQIEARYQIFESGEHWLDLGALVSYSFSKQPDAPDALEFKLLMQKDAGKFTHTANIGFAQNVGKFPQLTDEAQYSFIWGTRYRYSEEFQPGFEMQSDLGPASQLGNFNQQQHYVGPSAQGRLFGGLKYQFAYLFGASDPAAQRAVRLSLEYEMHF